MQWPIYFSGVHLIIMDNTKPFIICKTKWKFFLENFESINWTHWITLNCYMKTFRKSPDAIDRSLFGAHKQFQIYAFMHSLDRIRENVLMENNAVRWIYFTPNNLISTLNCPKLNLCIACTNEIDRKTAEREESFFFLLASKHQCKTFEFGKLFRFMYCMINTSFGVCNKSTWFISFCLYVGLCICVFVHLMFNVQCSQVLNEYFQCTNWKCTLHSQSLHNFRWIKAILIRIWRVIDTIWRYTLFLNTENNVFINRIIHVIVLSSQNLEGFGDILILYQSPYFIIHSMDLQTNR